MLSALDKGSLYSINKAYRLSIYRASVFAGREPYDPPRKVFAFEASAKHGRHSNPKTQNPRSAGKGCAWVLRMRVQLAEREASRQDRRTPLQQRMR
jgi:hypothetical protein